MDYIPTRISYRTPIPTPAQRAPISIKIDSTAKDNVNPKRTYDAAFLQDELENYLRTRKKGTIDQNTRKAIVIPVCNEIGKCGQRSKSNKMPIRSEANDERPFSQPAKHFKETSSKKVLHNSNSIKSNLVVEIYKDIQLSDSEELKKNAALRSDNRIHRSVIKQDKLESELKKSKDIPTNGAVKTKRFYDATFLNDEMDNYLRAQMTNAKKSKIGTEKNGGRQAVLDEGNPNNFKDISTTSPKACNVFQKPAKKHPSGKLVKDCNDTNSKAATQNSDPIVSSFNADKCSTLPAFSVIYQDLELSDSEDELKTSPIKDTVRFEAAQKYDRRDQSELKKAELKNSNNISTNGAVKTKRFSDATFLNDEMENYLRIKMTKAKKSKKDIKKEGLREAVPDEGKPSKDVFTISSKKPVSSLVGKVNHASNRSELKDGLISNTESLTAYKTLQEPAQELLKEKLVKHCNESSSKPAIQNSNPVIAEKCSTLTAYAELCQDLELSDSDEELDTSPKKDTLKLENVGKLNRKDEQAELGNAIKSSKDISINEAVKTKQFHDATFLSDKMDNYLLGKMINGKKSKNGINKKCRSKAVPDFKDISTTSPKTCKVFQKPAKKHPSEKLAQHCNETSSEPATFADKCSTLPAYSEIYQDLEISDSEDEHKTSPKKDTVRFEADQKYDRRDQSELKKAELKSELKNSKHVSANAAVKTKRFYDATFLNDEMDNHLRVKMTNAKNSKNGTKKERNRQTSADEGKPNIFKDISSTSQKRPVLNTPNRSEPSKVGSLISSAEIRTSPTKDTTKLKDVRKQERKSDSCLRITITTKNGIYKIRKGDSRKPVSHVKNNSTSTSKKPVSSLVGQQEASAKSDDHSNNYCKDQSTKSKEPKKDTAEVYSSQRKMSSKSGRNGLSAPTVFPPKKISKSLRLKQRFIELFGETSDDEPEAV